MFVEHSKFVGVDMTLGMDGWVVKEAPEVGNESNLGN